jgi:hypothetical protein
MTILTMFRFTPEALYVLIFAIMLAVLGIAYLWIATALALILWLSIDLIIASTRPRRYRLRYGGLQIALGVA